MNGQAPLDSSAVIMRVEFFGALAQLVEHLTFNQVVAGSIPARPTIFQIENGLFVFSEARPF